MARRQAQQDTGLVLGDVSRDQKETDQSALQPVIVKKLAFK